MSTVYFFIGYYLKDIIYKVSNNKSFILYGCIAIICGLLVYLNIAEIFIYKLDMKLGHYHNLIFDILVPCLFGLLIVLTCKYISLLNDKVVNTFRFIGKNTLPIMYLHIPINGALQDKLGYNFVGYIIISIIIPLVFISVCYRNKYLHFFFIGKIKDYSK